MMTFQKCFYGATNCITYRNIKYDFILYLYICVKVDNSFIYVYKDVCYGKRAINLGQITREQNDVILDTVDKECLVEFSNIIQDITSLLMLCGVESVIEYMDDRSEEAVD